MSRFVLKDTYFKKAKQDGYRARSAYKLKEIQTRFRLIKKGDRVLDLGCAPGSFLQVLSGIVGPGGYVVGIDVLPTQPLPFRNVVALTCNILDPGLGELLASHAPHGFDAVTCDISPNLSGIKEVDDKNIRDVYDAVRQVVAANLKKEGGFAMKSFFSENLKGIQDDLKGMFKAVSIFKPVASRSVSSEIYLVCTGKK
ncbi:SAM-dependent methyltransferase [Syntrophorhabdus aromaticivorans]|uniref:Ribosomal RNA large subunit methyltransferase E n=1 Tax=Syntrophorhabdus aromaticivorans TaxID=328301 RepID=A0A351TZT2_9BACT|nr:RlmE family RNA methyltransferase [Syntrophorhabdus aromaticivorans]NLW34972.1 RlmE family RNA methyltransferase [Syntrophorhabdus aromaticivorans]HBA53213.1 RlmE family RNA methyltransferase [Syntrophorhabdus aromaticivorans]